MTLKEFRDVLSPVIGSDSQAGWIEKFYKEVRRFLILTSVTAL